MFGCRRAKSALRAAGGKDRTGSAQIRRLCSEPERWIGDVDQFNKNFIVFFPYDFNISRDNMLSTYFNLIFDEFKGSKINISMIYSSWRWFKLRRWEFSAATTSSNNKTGMLSNSEVMLWKINLWDLLATRDSNGQRGRYPIETRFQTGCCLHANIYYIILYHWLHWTMVTCWHMLASWIFHGIPMFPSQVVLSLRIRWLSSQVTRNPRPRQQAWEHLGKSGLVFFFERWGFPGHVPAFWHGISSVFFSPFLGQSEAQHIFSSVLTWNFPMCSKKWWSSKFSQAMLELGHWCKLPSSTARGEEGRAKGC